jgi:hypothetical protein
MESSRRNSLTLVFTILILGILACGPLAQTQEADLNLAGTQTMEALDLIVAATLQASSGGEGESGESSPEPVEEEPAAEVTPTATVEHVARPENPGSLTSYMTDRSTKALAAERRAIADNFDKNLVERPFTSEVMDYVEHLDITRAELSLSGSWVYVTIFLEGEPPADSQAVYAVEIDGDLDGRGDWYISGVVPASSDWTTDGVFVWRDSNNDVGGVVPLEADPPQPVWDGYDEQLFAQGIGTDPDAAWIRRSPTQPDRVQLAFKYSLIDSDGEFMWGVWSEEMVIQPGWMDYNDHFTPEEAGSPEISSSLYPIKQVAMMDNTCRWTVGFTPDGTEPGVCYVAPPTPTPTITPTVTMTPTATLEELY